MKTAEEILKDNMNENLWTFICTYPVAYKSDLMLKDWIIEAMKEYAKYYASQFQKELDVPSEEEIEHEASNYCASPAEFGDVQLNQMAYSYFLDGTEWAISEIQKRNK